MAIAYWCVLIAALLPYVWVTVAKSSGERYDNRDPRGWTARQANPRVHRANAAQFNSYEAFAPFAAGVILAQLAGVAADRIALLSILFVLFRIVHGLVYVAGWKHAVRSLAWFAAFICVLLLLGQAALQVA
ncbi:MAPEG family protein [Lysobacter terrestris]|uniref:MAPEG family protein n=1 Tax=Agrilutibacter terrestris TaxID=2865112 RepID=A0A7H0G1F4_9GAMM|nr:MAPEG family protein [Lysobacter terrestris]